MCKSVATFLFPQGLFRISRIHIVLRISKESSFLREQKSVKNPLHLDGQVSKHLTISFFPNEFYFASLSMETCYGDV
jgi:hypothetical protein